MFRYRHDSRALVRWGTVASVVALCLPVVVGVAALGLDGGLLYLKRRQAQSAADGAALAGAYALGTGSSFSTAQTRAIDLGARYGITISSAQVTQPDAGSVSVSVTSNQPRLFSALWGSGTTSVRASATAV